MEKILNKLIFGLAILVLGQFSYGQQTAGVRGTVMDSKGAVEFVEVNLKRATDTTKIIASTTTDSHGSYLLQGIVKGDYQLQFRLIGYKSIHQQLQLDATVVALDPIVLVENATVLNSVTIDIQKKIIQKTQEGFVFNAGSTLSQMGGTATDLLKNVPTLSMDADGGLTLRGKTPMILINGKNSTITNFDQIAASSIESIEVVTNPSAKYDANAESGVINIKLKKNNLAGTNGSLVTGAGFGAKGRANSSLIVNHKSGKWNFGLGYDNRFAGRTRHIDAGRTNYFIADEYLLNQNRNDSRLEQLQNLKLNVDFSPNERNSFSFEVIGNMEGQDNNETLRSTIFNNLNAFYSDNQRHSLEIERSKVAEMALNYQRKFKDDRKSLTSSITTSFNRDRQNTDIDTYYYDALQQQLGSVFLQKTHNYENQNISNAKLDYAFPVAKQSIIETGYKGTFRFFNSDYQSADNVNNGYVVNTASSNTFKFDEQITAFYAMMNSFLGDKDSPKWKYNFGLRAEQVHNHGKTITQNTDFTNNYLKFFPSASLQYHMKANSFLKFAYTKRINRPDLGQLNPFMDITDALNPHSGNPYLKPEIVHGVELGYSNDGKLYNFTFNSYYRNASNSIKQYSDLQSDGTVLLSPKNFGTTITYGLETIVGIKAAPFYDTNLSLNAFQQNINGSNIANDVGSKAFNWYGKWINNFVPWSGGKLQLIGSYNSRLSTAQGNRIAIYSADLGFQQKLGKGNARLGLVVTDMFNTLKSGYLNSTADFTNFRTSKSDTRAVMLTFAYTFKTAFKEKLLENQFKPEY